MYTSITPILFIFCVKPIFLSHNSFKITCLSRKYTFFYRFRTFLTQHLCYHRNFCHQNLDFGLLKLCILAAEGLFRFEITFLSELSFEQKTPFSLIFESKTFLLGRCPRILRSYETFVAYLIFCTVLFRVYGYYV